jgi:hypothetical protein
MIFLVILGCSASVASAQQLGIVWQTYRHVTSHTAIGLFNGNIWLLGVQDEDSCGTDLTEITWVDRNTGVVLDSMRFGVPNCTNGIETNLEKVYASRQNRVVITGTIANCPTCTKNSGIVQFDNSGFDTLARYYHPIPTIDFVGVNTYAIIDLNSMHIITGAYDTLHTISNVVGTEDIIRYDSVLNKVYSVNRVVSQAGQSGIQIIIADSTLSNPVFDTLDIRPNQLERPHFVSTSIVPDEFVIVSRTTNVATDVSVFNSATSQKTLIPLPFHKFNEVKANDSKSAFYVACHTGLNTSVADHVVYRFDAVAKTVTDSVRLPFGVSPHLQLDYAADGYLYVVHNRYMNSISDYVVYQLSPQLNIISTVIVPDTIINSPSWIRDVVAGENGEVYFVLAGLQPYESIIYKVQMSPTGITTAPAMHCTYTGSYVNSANYQLKFEPLCDAKRVDMYNTLGQVVSMSEVTSGTMLLQAPATGVYIIQVLFENGELKREKVFLTAH